MVADIGRRFSVRCIACVTRTVADSLSRSRTGDRHRSGNGTMLGHCRGSSRSSRRGDNGGRIRQWGLLRAGKCTWSLNLCANWGTHRLSAFSRRRRGAAKSKSTSDSAKAITNEGFQVASLSTGTLRCCSWFWRRGRSWSRCRRFGVKDFAGRIIILKHGL